MDPRESAARRLLRELGATELEHPGGTLLAHLDRVADQLTRWGAHRDLRLAGLCHAFYGTDGFALALLPPERRDELAAVIGTAAEESVYCYAACDRKASYPTLAAPDAAFRDRFTGVVHTPALHLRRHLAEITAANELDLARHDPAFHARWSGPLLTLFTRLRPLLSEPAWQDCVRVLAGRQP
ncbi:DUF6817 domain-containing protein [Kitasatospora nipponensis]|uniref:DUF6817 domain-containing protein n=1 Tax=Kitasatospora nipponensis TaxID=258049 RepID=UPI0031DFE62A